MKIVIAPASFKGTLTSRQAGDAMRAGALQVLPDAEIIVIPVADGGEGTVEALVEARGGRYDEIDVHGPLGEPRSARFGWLDPATCVIEMAASSGLTLVPEPQRDPTQTTTYGVGEQIAAALDRGARSIYVGVGGSATVDGGCGAAQALGVRFFDRDDRPIANYLTGGLLGQIARIDATARDRRLNACDLSVLCDVTNSLCGARGAARVFGPQKFDPRRPIPMDEVERLERNLEHLAAAIAHDMGMHVADVPRGGAAGGLAAGLHAFAGAKLVGGIDAILDLIDFDRRLAGADLVLTGEGCLDAQSLMGKAVSGIAARARDRGIRTIAIAGSLGEGADACRTLFDEIHAASSHDARVPSSMREAAEWVSRKAAEVLRALRPR